MILDTCEETVLLSEGRIVCQGKTKDILKNKELLEKHDMELPLCMQNRRTNE